MPMRIEVEALPDEVAQVLRAELTPEDMATLSVRAPHRDPFAPTPHRDLPTVQTVVEFAAGAIAGGVLYDGVKATLRRAAAILKARYGDKSRLRDDENDSAG